MFYKYNFKDIKYYSFQLSAEKLKDALVKLNTSFKSAAKQLKKFKDVL